MQDVLNNETTQSNGEFQLFFKMFINAISKNKFQYKQKFESKIRIRMHCTIDFKMMKIHSNIL